MRATLIAVPALVLACAASAKEDNSVRQIGAAEATPATATPTPTTLDPRLSQPPPLPPASSRGLPDPHVHDPVTSDENGVDEELQTVTSKDKDCTAKCTGGDLGIELRSALVAIARRGRHCYGVAMVGDTTLKGTVSVDLRVSSQGNVCSARVTNGTLKSRAVWGCLEKLFREQKGLPGATDCVKVRIPMRFESQEVFPETPSKS